MDSNTPTNTSQPNPQMDDLLSQMDELTQQAKQLAEEGKQAHAQTTADLESIEAEANGAKLNIEKIFGELDAANGQAEAKLDKLFAEQFPATEAS